MDDLIDENYPKNPVPAKQQTIFKMDSKTSALEINSLNENIQLTNISRNLDIPLSRSKRASLDVAGETVELVQSQKLLSDQSERESRNECESNSPIKYSYEESRPFQLAVVKESHPFSVDKFPGISELAIVEKCQVSELLNDCHLPAMFEEFIQCNESQSSGLLQDSGLPFGSHINPNILNCGLCGKMCKRAVFLPCCVPQACNGCAVIEVTKNRMCWGCKNPVNCTRELIHDKVLREAIEWFRKNGTIKMAHGESLLERRQLRTKQVNQRNAYHGKPEVSTDAFMPEKDVILKHDSPQSIEVDRKNRSKSPEYIQTKNSSRQQIKRSRNKNKSIRKGQNKRMRIKNKRIRSRSDASKRLNISSLSIIEGDSSQNVKQKVHKNSPDPEELTDINCENWEKIKRLKTDQERLWLAKSEFQNPICVNPTTNLTYHGYKRRKVFMLQNENINSFYEFYSNPEIVRLKEVKSEKRQTFYLQEGNSVAMPGYTKVLKLDKQETIAPMLGEVEETMSTKEFKVLIEKEFHDYKNPSKNLSKVSVKARDNFMSQFSHFKAGCSEAINFLQFYKLDLEKRRVEEIVFLENLYKSFTVCYGKMKPIFCKTCNIRHCF